ncbi:MAG: hypothetical protein LV481_00640 [Methylacidiphilales bacterium]|nr:hypothetical protein [Candidatus Methylacidiphilales bacterium]
MSIINLSIEQLKQAISIKEEIATLEQKLASFINGKSLQEAAAVVVPAKRGRKKMSPEAKARIAAAATARWAKIKGTPVASPVTKKRTFSPEHRAKLIAAAKARWNGKKTQAPAIVKASPATKKGGITPEGRARIVAALKARWAKKKK